MNVEILYKRINQPKYLSLQKKKKTIFQLQQSLTVKKKETTKMFEIK